LLRRLVGLIGASFAREESSLELLKWVKEDLLRTEGLLVLKHFFV